MKNDYHISTVRDHELVNLLKTKLREISNYKPNQEELVAINAIYLDHEWQIGGDMADKLPQFQRWHKYMSDILQFLKLQGEQMDTAIAAATRISLANARLVLRELETKKKVMCCLYTKFENDKRTEGMLCRIAGYIPTKKLGVKSKVDISFSKV
jgi:hypothetical protein